LSSEDQAAKDKAIVELKGLEVLLWMCQQCGCDACKQKQATTLEEYRAKRTAFETKWGPPTEEDLNRAKLFKNSSEAPA
jgi:hypothetical protein